MDFNPNEAAGSDSGVFGLPFSEKDSKLVLIPVPWEVTTSYGGGTSKGPEAVLAASHQVDLFDLDFGRIYEPGIFMRPHPTKIEKLNQKGKKLAKKLREISSEKKRAPLLKEVNSLGLKLNSWVEAECDALFKNKKIPALLGGDHSVPFGAFKSAAKHHKELGLLHFDAHSDTRDAYEGFQWSHASILRNAIEKIPALSKLVQVGIRDFCEEEYQYVLQKNEKIQVFFDAHLADALHRGVKWSDLAKKIVSSLPKKVWITFDIDGMDPRFCPNTGTPVPGGLDFHQIRCILLELVRSGREVVGFDLNEIAPSQNGEDEWDANVGARVLYKLCGATFASNGLVPLMNE